MLEFNLLKLPGICPGSYLQQLQPELESRGYGNNVQKGKRKCQKYVDMLVLYSTKSLLGVPSIHKIQLGNTFLCSLARSIVFPSDNIRVPFASFLLDISNYITA